MTTCLIYERRIAVMTVCILRPWGWPPEIQLEALAQICGIGSSGLLILDEPSLVQQPKSRMLRDTYCTDYGPSSLKCLAEVVALSCFVDLLVGMAFIPALSTE